MLKYPYVIAPNDQLTKEFPVFTLENADVGQHIPSFFANCLTESSPEFAEKFARGGYKQDRGFMAQIGSAILNGDTTHFELLDNQRRAFHLCLATAREKVKSSGERKSVVIVEGPPGSGKSAVAANLWASLVSDAATAAGNVSLVTTSQSQSSNWTRLIDMAAADRVGRGVARKATSFVPLSTPRLGQLRQISGNPHLYKSAAEWRENFDQFSASGEKFSLGSETNGTLISIVDEAHALIDPSREFGVGQFGFVTGLGPQAFHIIRCSKVTVFLLDPKQSFRARENTRVADIESWAEELGATVERVSLAGSQFRCAGSAEYVAWVDSLLGGASAELNRVFASAWHAAKADSEGVAVASAGNVFAFPSRKIAGSLNVKIALAASAGRDYDVFSTESRLPRMEFQVFEYPHQMEAALRNKQVGNRIRLASTYSRPWKTRGSGYPHQFPPEHMDFHERSITSEGNSNFWSRPWNFVPREDYTPFVLGREGFPIAVDPLCEVGCTYAVRGFDFDYLGVLWLEDVAWRDGRWVVNPEFVHESGITQIRNRAVQEISAGAAGQATEELLAKVCQAYRILLTRAIKGIYLCVPDKVTREHILSSLSG
jgi:DUF2075 family protein